MQPGKTPRRRAGACSIAALALLCALLPAAAAAKRPGHGDLSARLAELAKPSVRALPLARQARGLGVAATGPGSILRDGDRVLLSVRFERGAAAAVEDLRAAGARVLDVARRYQTVTAAARPTGLRKIAAVPGVVGVAEILAPVTSAAGAGPVGAAATSCFGAATSEGDSQLRAQEAREMFEVDGTGVTVGVLSDSYDQDQAAPTSAGDDIASGDLPGPSNPCELEDTVAVLDDSESDGEDEGRAMAQIVHDLAPGANLAFATAFTPDVFGFADNIRELAKPVASGGAEADVIVDDVLYFEEPFFQEGPVGVAVREVSEGGVNYFSSTGNNNLRRSGKDIASWEAPAFRDAGGCPTALPDYAEHCLDFDPEGPVDSTFLLEVAAGAKLQVDLQWAQPWNGVTTDFDAYLIDDGGLLASSENFNVASSQIPFEFLSWTNSTGSAQTVKIAINRCDAVCGGANGGDTSSPRLKFVLFQNGSGVTETEYEESSGGDVVGPTIFGHNGAATAISVGAIRFNTTVAPESFSSRGPVTHYFGPVEGVTPAAPLGLPLVLAKPDLVATDGGANTFFGSCFEAWRFFGTSAAAPHAAAVAALERQAQTAATAEEVDQAQIDGAVPVGAFTPEAVGAGMLDAVASIEALGVTPTATAQPEPPPGPASCAEEPEPEPEEKPDPPQPPPPPGPSPQPPQAEDRTAPQTFLRRRPAKTLFAAERTARAVFKFGSNEQGVTFLCKFDRKPFRVCLRRTVRRFALGPHLLRVKARDRSGNVDRTPARYRFEVKSAE
jgi:hypothetical protein